MIHSDRRIGYTVGDSKKNSILRGKRLNIPRSSSRILQNIECMLKLNRTERIRMSNLHIFGCLELPSKLQLDNYQHSTQIDTHISHSRTTNIESWRDRNSICRQDGTSHNGHAHQSICGLDIQAHKKYGQAYIRNSMSYIDILRDQNMSCRKKNIVHTYSQKKPSLFQYLILSLEKGRN